MTDEPGVNNPQPSRRRVLQMVNGLTALSVSSVVTSSSVAADPGDQLWSFETGADFWSSPTVVDGTVFVGIDDNNLYAVDAETGSEEWAFETGDTVLSSPTVVDGTVFVGSDDGNLYAVDAETGSEEWAFETGDSVRSSPTVVDGTVLVGSDNSNLYAVDAEYGNEKWAFETDGSDIGGFESPTVVDGTVFVGSDEKLYAVDAETGEEEWAFDTGNSPSSPTVVDGTVFVSSGHFGPLGVNAEREIEGLHAVDAETGQEEWAFETGDSVFEMPTVVDGTVFVGSTDQNLYAVDAETGREEWAFETGNYVSSSPTVVGGTVFIGSGDNNLYAVDAETGSEQWAFETGDSVDSSPTVVDGTVFVGSDDGNLYAVDAGVPGSSEGSRTRLGTLGHHGDWAYADQSLTISQQEPDSGGLIPSVGAVSPPTLLVAGGGIVGAGMYALRRSRQGGENTDTDTVTRATDTTTSNPPSDSATEDSATEESATEDSATGDATGDSDLRERATELLTQAEEAETDGAYQQAADAYEEATTHLEQAIAGDEADENSEALKAQIEESTASLASVNAVIEDRESVTTTLQAAERSFKEAIARYAAAEQTVARIRFRQARDAFEEAQQAILESDTEVLAQPIAVGFEQEATLPSLALEELAVLEESTVKTLAGVDIESITDLEADPENEEITPAVVSDLAESDELSSDETALLTILSWWYEGASQEFTSERVISRRYEQADYGFNQST